MGNPSFHKSRQLKQFWAIKPHECQLQKARFANKSLDWGHQVCIWQKRRSTWVSKSHSRQGFAFAELVLDHHAQVESKNERVNHHLIPNISFYIIAISRNIYTLLKLFLAVFMNYVWKELLVQQAHEVDSEIHSWERSQWRGRTQASISQQKNIFTMSRFLLAHFSESESARRKPDKPLAFRDPVMDVACDKQRTFQWWRQSWEVGEGAPSVT